MKYKRVLLKLSGEALAKKVKVEGKEKIDSIFDDEKIAEIAGAVKKLTDDGLQVGIVIGAGNIWRGGKNGNVKRARADEMGMLGTMINCLRMEDALEKAGVPARVLSPLSVTTCAEQYDYRKAISFMEEGKAVLFGAGTGIPFVTTDTTVVVRAAEIEADIILCAKNIDGVYTENPIDEKGEKKPGVPRYKVVTYDKCLSDQLGATDVSASALAKEQKIEMYLFELANPENIIKAAHGEEIGTLVTYKDVESVLY